jgi:DNA modification methylase
MKAEILVGDVRKSLRGLPDGSVRCVVTSPPYWGLRDYGHDGQIGLEQTPELYVAEMVEVFREVRRVLADDGTLWLNLGDSYKPAGNGSTKKGLNERYFGKQFATDKQGADEGHVDRSKLQSDGIKQKELVGIPWRVAFSLQADGWYLRQDIIWAKPNPMPESVTDRCTKAHEYLFLLTKNARYYYDNVAIKEPVSEASLKRAEYGWDSDRPSTKNASMGGTGIHVEKMGTRFVNPDGRNKRSVWTITTKPFKEAHFAVMPEALVEPCVLAGSARGDTVLDPFSGSGTVGVVALKHERNYIGCELNPEYADLSRKRILDDAPLMNTVEVL